MSAYARRAWAQRYLDRVSGPLPRYGSLEWQQLPDSDPAKVASCVIAAESWASTGDDLEESLRAELDAYRLADKQAEDAEYVETAREHRERHKHLKLVKGAYADQPQFLRGGAS